MLDDVLKTKVSFLNSLDVTDSYQKVAVSKEIVKLICGDPKQLSFSTIASSLEIISDLYFTLEIRDQLKKSLKSLLSEVDLCQDKLSLDAAFCRSLKSETKAQVKLGCENIISCLDSFPAGLKAIKVSLKQVFQFLRDGLRYIHEQINLSPGPQEVTVLFGVLQSVFKAVCLTVQECNRSAVAVERNQETLVEVYDLVLGFLINDSTLLNSRHSAGIAVANILRMFFTKDIHKAIHERNPKLPFEGRYVLCNVYVMKDVSYPAELAAWGGLLASLVPAELVESSPSDRHCLLNDDIFPKIIDVQGGKEDSSILLSHARIVLLWTEKACAALRECTLTQNEMEKFYGASSIGEQLFKYVWSVWDHFMDGVRFHARAIFENTVTMHLLSTKDEPSESAFLQDMCKQLLSLPWYQKGKYGPLCYLTSCMGSQAILNMQPNLTSLLIEALDDGSMATNIGEFLCCLCESHLTEVDFCHWQNFWLGPLLQVLECGTKVQKTSVQQQILPKLFKMEAKIFPFVIQQLSEKTFLTKEGSVSVLLSCLKIAKSNKVSFSKVSSVNAHNHQENLWKNCLSYEVLKTALCHADEQVRLDALGLVCDSPKTSESFSENELDLMKTFIQYNVNVQSPAFRQKMLGFFKKFLNRICDSAQPILKKQSLKISTLDNECTLIRNYQHFLDWLWHFLFSCLHPEANFPRRGSALQIINLMKEIVGLHTGQRSEERKGLHLLVSSLDCQTVLECLRDTYENNKQLALQFLSGSPGHLLPFQNKTYLDDMLSVCFQLASSIRPPDSITAAYLLQAVALHSEKEILLSSDLLSYSWKPESQEEVPLCVHYALVSTLLQRLKRELGTASISLLKAAGREPMYGLLACIRYLIIQASPQLRLVEACKAWQDLISQLIEVSMEVTAVVQPVVCNASPEGHLPMDTNPESVAQLQTMIQKAVGRRFMHAVVVTPTEISQTGSNHTEVGPVLEVDWVKTRAVTAQMLLLCSWRTHREVSLLLGHLCQSLMIESDNKPGLISTSQMQAMGDFFIQQLTEIKHRGAFEEAYVGFCKLCSRLWRCESSCLHELPRRWLSDLLLAVSLASDDAMCLTRRSAGLPFIVQALLISEPEGANGACFKEAMTTLLQMAILEDDKLDPNFATKTQVHAINILRALFREANLGEMVMPYVAEGLKASILGFKGNTWMLRNAATLLLSTLVTRVFGVNRSRELELQKKNCMTGRVFFQRFPNLFPFLLEELRNTNLTMHHVDSMYPVLLLLSRLYPSPMEGCDSYLQLGAFLPYVVHCGRSDLHLTRRLAARAMVPLLSPHSIITHLEKMFDILRKGATQNTLHGTLLQISSIMDELNSQPASVQEEVKTLISKLLGTTAKFLAGSDWCIPVKIAYLDMIWSALCNGIVCPDILCDWIRTECLANSTNSNLIGDDCYQSELTKLFIATHLTPATSFSSNLQGFFEEILPKLLRPSRSYESRMVTLDSLSWLLDKEQECLQSRSLDMVPLKQRHAWHRVCDQTRKESVVTAIKESAGTLYKMLQECLKNESHSWCRTELYYILSVEILNSEVNISVIHLEEILSVVVSEANCVNVEDEAVSMLHYSAQLAKAIFHLGIKNEMISSRLEGWCSFVYSCCQPEGSTARRKAAASAICTCSFLLTDIRLDNYWTQIVGPLWDSYILLLQDDEPEIRDTLCLMHLQQENVYSQPLVSSLTLDQALKCLVNIWSGTKPLHCLAFLLELALRTDHSSNLDNNMTQESDEQPFDKGELNVFAEEIALTKLVCKHIDLVLSLSFAQLDPSQELPCMSWIPKDHSIFVNSISVMSVVKHCIGKLQKLAADLSACTLDSVFVCHLFDSLCIQIFQQSQVLNCLLHSASSPALVEDTFYSTVQSALQSWPYRNNFLDSILALLNDFQKSPKV